MKKLLLAAALVASTTANALDVTTVKIDVNCAKSNDMIKHMGEFNLEPVLLSEKSLVNDPEVPEFPGTTVVWRNGETADYAISFTPDADQNITCVLVYGEKLTVFE